MTIAYRQAGLAIAFALAAPAMACAATPQTNAEVQASTKLASALGINEVPMLVVNGRELPANAPYDVLKKIVEYQIKVDGLTE